MKRLILAALAAFFVSTAYGAQVYQPTEQVGTFKANIISESTAGSGVTVDGVLLKDSGVTGVLTGNASTATALASNPTDCSANQFANAIAANGNLTCAAISDADIPADLTLDLTGTLKVDTVAEHTTGSGVTIDGVLLKDSTLIEKVTPVAAGSYDLLATDKIIHVTYTTTGAVSLQLMTATVVSGRVYIIKDAGTAGTNNITISTEGAQKIDGQDTFLLVGDKDSVSLYCDGTNWNSF